jgi:hypothetical protein
VNVVTQQQAWPRAPCFDWTSVEAVHRRPVPPPQGLFAVARRFYLLFQQHTTDAFNRSQQEFLANDGS